MEGIEDYIACATDHKTKLEAGSFKIKMPDIFILKVEN